MTRKQLGTTLAFLSLIIVAGTVVYWFRLANQVAIPEDRTLFVVLFLSAVAMAIASFVIGTRWFGVVAAILAIIPGLFLPFTVAISKQEVAENPIAVGDSIPYFVGIDDEGERFVSSVLSGTPVLVKFFRAHW